MDSHLLEYSINKAYFDGDITEKPMKGNDKPLSVT